MTITSVSQISYLREFSVGGLLRCSLQIYRRNFLTLFLIYALPAFPFGVAQMEAQSTGRPMLALIAVCFNLLVGLVAFGAITIAVSGICIGERPGVIRSYRALGGATLARLAWANLLQLAALFVGFLLLVVPGLILTVRLVFTPIVAVLEGVTGRAAFTRSAALSRSFYWRNVKVLLLFLCVLWSVFALSGVVMGVVAAVSGGSLMTERITRTLLMLVMVSLYPWMFAALTLMYYDLRVRKEAYDLRALAEDLRR